MSEEKKKVVCIVQARMGSTRLPAKIALQLVDKMVLEHVVDRLKMAKLVDEVVVATTVEPADDEVDRICERNHFACFRGSEEDVLLRYYEAAKKYITDVIIRVTSDCPLIDPKIIDKMVKVFLEHDYPMVSNVGLDPQLRTFPRGLDVEIFSFETLEMAHTKAKEKYQREHVTPYLYEQLKNIYYFKNRIDYSSYRWTLDTKEDLDLIKEIYQSLYRGRHNFFLNQIISLFKYRPELKVINQNIIQKSLH